MLAICGRGWKTAKAVQSPPKFHTKGSSHSSVDSPGARTLVFAEVESIFKLRISGVNSANTLLCSTMALPHRLIVPLNLGQSAAPEVESSPGQVQKGPGNFSGPRR